MFKPVRVVATIVFLAMIIMIFISAFVLNNGTLCISESPLPLIFFSPSITVSGTLLKREMQSSSCSSTSRFSGTRYRTSPMRVLQFSRCLAWHNALAALPSHLPLPHPALVWITDHVVTSNLFLTSTLVSGYIISRVVATLPFILPYEPLLSFWKAPCKDSIKYNGRGYRN